MYIKSLTILCISQLTLQAAQYVNLTDIKLNLLKCNVKLVPSSIFDNEAKETIFLAYRERFE